MTAKFESLDKLDRRIISTLLSNGRESIANMSRRIGLSRTAVAERISRLERMQVITGYTIKLGKANAKPKAICYLLINCSKGQKGAVCEFLEEIPEIKHASVVGGGFDIICLVEAYSLHFAHVICDRVESIPGIEKVCLTVELHQAINRQ